MITRPVASQLLFSLSRIEKQEILRRNRQPVTIPSTYNASDPIAGRLLHPWAPANGLILHETEGAGVGSARVDGGPYDPRLPGFQAGGTAATLTADLMKTPVHFVALGFLSCFLAADVLLERGRRTKEARIPRLDKGANR